MLKQISLAAVATTLIAGSAAVAHAEIGGGGFNTSAGMQRDWRETHGDAVFVTGPSADTNAYNFAPDSGPPRSHHRRRSVGTKHGNK
jgi:hypothetical protein